VNRRQLLSHRRLELVGRCSAERRDLEAAAQDAARSLWAVDAAVALTRRAARQPLLLTGAVVAIVMVVRPRRVWALALWGVSAIATSIR
jgi:hypothetical protein